MSIQCLDPPAAALVEPPAPKLGEFNSPVGLRGVMSESCLKEERKEEAGMASELLDACITSRVIQHTRVSLYLSCY